MGTDAQAKARDSTCPTLAFHGSDLRKALQIRSRFDAPFPLDLLVRKPRFVSERLRERDMFIERVVNQGVVMYENQHA